MMLIICWPFYILQSFMIYIHLLQSIDTFSCEVWTTYSSSSKLLLWDWTAHSGMRSNSYSFRALGHIHLKFECGSFFLMNRTFVWVMLLCKFPICTFDGICWCCSLNTKDLHDILRLQGWDSDLTLCEVVQEYLHWVITGVVIAHTCIFASPH